MNLVFITGRLCKDPECRYTNDNTAIARFTVATNEGKDKDGNSISTFIKCVAFKKTAETIDRYFFKGNPIVIVGKWHNNNWEDKDGNKHYSDELWVDRFEFAQGKERVLNARDVEPGSTFEDIADDDSKLPF